MTLVKHLRVGETIKLDDGTWGTILAIRSRESVLGPLYTIDTDVADKLGYGGSEQVETL